MINNLSKREKIALYAAIALGAIIIILLVLDFSGLCRGISDLFTFPLSAILILVYYLQRKSEKKFMPRFYLCCGIMMLFLSVCSLILYFVR